jgi:hypothetical protein
LRVMTQILVEPGDSCESVREQLSGLEDERDRTERPGDPMSRTATFSVSAKPGWPAALRPKPPQLFLRKICVNY